MTTPILARAIETYKSSDGEIEKVVFDVADDHYLGVKKQMAAAPDAIEGHRRWTESESPQSAKV